MSIDEKALEKAFQVSWIGNIHDVRRTIEAYEAAKVPEYAGGDMGEGSAVKAASTGAQQPDDCIAAFEARYAQCLGSPEEVDLHKSNAWYNFRAGWKARPQERESVEVKKALTDARDYILNRHNMGRLVRAKQRLWVVGTINEALNQIEDEAGA